MLLSCAGGGRRGALGWSQMCQCLQGPGLHTHLWQKEESEKLSVMVFKGRGHKWINKKHVWKWTMELEHSGRAKRAVASPHPRKFSAQKKANPPLRVCILSTFLWINKGTSQSQNTTQGGSKRHYSEGELPPIIQPPLVNKWEIGLTEARAQTRWFPETQSLLPPFSVSL